MLGLFSFLSSVVTYFHTFTIPNSLCSVQLAVENHAWVALAIVFRDSSDSECKPNSNYCCLSGIGWIMSFPICTCSLLRASLREQTPAVVRNAMIPKDLRTNAFVNQFV